MTLIQKGTGFLTISKDWVGLRISTLEKVELAICCFWLQGKILMQVAQLPATTCKRNASGYIDSQNRCKETFGSGALISLGENS